MLNTALHAYTTYVSFSILLNNYLNQSAITKDFYHNVNIFGHLMTIIPWLLLIKV